MNRKIIYGLIIVLLMIGGSVGYIFQKQPIVNQSLNKPVAPETEESEPTKLEMPTPQTTKTVKAQEISGVARDFQFEATIPENWRAESVPGSQAINLYDPAGAETENLEKSQIFIRSFKANDFLTLSTVTIHSKRDLTLGGRPAIEYDIEKKAGVANFPSQPLWRNTRHIVTDIRVADTNPSVFYVIAKRPDLDQKIYQAFIENLKVMPKTSLVEPVSDFKARITKKPFGILINPQTSPVQPEKFSGYHTGVDVEYSDKDEDIPVRAIAQGEIIQAKTVSGYGGVIVAKHTVDTTARAVLYGHVDPKRLPKAGQEVSPGEIIGYLGRGGTSETDGERKHLHFSILKSEQVDLRGYVKTQSELASWLNPLDFF